MLAAGCAAALVSLFPPRAQAQAQGDSGWRDATQVTAVSSAVVSLLMPRIFYSNPEATVGWKARWHVSVLAPVMTQTTLAFVNEQFLKEAFKDPVPGCGNGCSTFGLFSTESYLASATTGQGVAVFLADTIQNSGGRFHMGSFAGHVLLPLTLTAITAGGRIAGDLESPEQVLASVGLGLALGFGVGAIYGFALEPKCGYSGNLICW